MTATTARRGLIVALAAGAGLLGWAGLRLGGAELRADTTTVGAADVVVAALLAGCGAWLCARVLDARVSRPRSWWVLTSTTGLSVSMLGPTYSAPALTAVGLMFLHFLVGAALIGGFAVTLPHRKSVADA